MITVQLELVKALPEDLKIWSSDQQKYVIKQGQLFFIQSKITNLLEGPYILSNETDTQALLTYLQLEMIYIPVNNFDSKIPVLSEAETPVLSEVETPVLSEAKPKIQVA